MESIKVKRAAPPSLTNIFPIPPHNGFGSEEDSLLNVKYLDPSHKVHEYVSDKFKRDKHILRYQAKLISPYPSDEERSFIVSFYVRDEAIQVYEVAKRNSGRQNCKFLEKKRMKNPYTNKYYSEKDMGIGQVLYLNKFIFKLLDCDEYTRKYMNDNAEIFIDSDLNMIIPRILQGSCKYENIEEYLVHVLKEIDPEGKHFVTLEEIEEGFKKLEVFLTKQELSSISFKIEKNGDGLYSMESLYNLLLSKA